MKDLREELAKFAHESWSGWMGYLFSKCIENPDGTVTVPKRLGDRWRRQVATAYGELPESEKASDREEADKILAITRDQHE